MSMTISVTTELSAHTCGKSRQDCRMTLLDDLMVYTGNSIMLVEAKCDKEMLMDCLPEATSLAIALSEVTGDNAVRYRLSDHGAKWMFQAYTRDAEGNGISYEGPLLQSCIPQLAKASRKMYNASWSYRITG
ncbi:hypothetical protein EDD15DRAFT_2190472 [Pisolithus albus]|nr:hypothetical protein EDD15DRAFT_2203714 [Pisolithus albus]KAI5981683.1 hypothetical protein EDD15DRAFT_2203718 [Pisolithus albus]KAI6006774.1 hypothetical protein EDD15DRAFT_2190472 [Pisolithus albus]